MYDLLCAIEEASRNSVLAEIERGNFDPVVVNAYHSRLEERRQRVQVADEHREAGLEEEFRRLHELQFGQMPEGH